MKILVTGSTGLVGSALVPFLTTGGHSVTRLARRTTSRPSLEPTVHWDPILGTIDHQGLEGHDAVVHLAGENISATEVESVREELPDPGEYDGKGAIVSFQLVQQFVNAPE